MVEIANTATAHGLFNHICHGTNIYHHLHHLLAVFKNYTTQPPTITLTVISALRKTQLLMPNCSRFWRSKSRFVNLSANDLYLDRRSTIERKI